MPKAPLREAVLLSLGLEPRPPVSPVRYAEPGREYDRRLMLAAAHVDPAGPLRPLGSMPFLNGAEGATVSLSEFGAWAQALGLPLPERFPRQQAPEPREATPSAAPVVPEIDYSLLAPREQLIEAFGKFTGMDMSWFEKLEPTHALYAARKVAGQGGRGHIIEPMFCPYEVMLWLIDPKRRRKGRKLSEGAGWRMLKGHFPKVHAAHSDYDPNGD
jgi:hypothetical protein